MTDMPESQKPCPFCGGSRQSIRLTGRPYPELWEVLCHGNSQRACDASMWGETEERAVDEWNTRAPISPAEAAERCPEVAALVDCLSGFLIYAEGTPITKKEADDMIVNTRAALAPFTEKETE